MASIQACGSAEAYHEKHKPIVKEMSDIAHGVVNKHCHDQGAATAGCIKNNARGNCIKFLCAHDWSVNFSKLPYPQSIPKGDKDTFVHVTLRDRENDEAAVVYSDECGSGWLLAWSVKNKHWCGSGNQVYVETGPIANYMNINWGDIKAKLHKSRDTSYCVDPCNENEAFAKVSGGNSAALVATFNSFSC